MHGTSRGALRKTLPPLCSRMRRPLNVPLETNGTSNKQNGLTGDRQDEEWCPGMSYIEWLVVCD